MKRKETIEILKAEIAVPEVVQRNAESAFERIRLETARDEDTNVFSTVQLSQEMRGGRSPRQRWKLKRAWLAAAAAVLTVGVLGAGGAAAYMQWSRSLEEGLQTTVEQRQALEDSSMVSFLGQSVTQGDVKITAQQSIVDKYFAYISFKVEGYSVEDGIQPGFTSVDISVGDGDEEFLGGYTHGFYTGLIADATGRVLHADGSELGENGQISYTLADGTLEYQVLMQSEEEGCFIGKPIAVTLKDLGTYTGENETVEVDAKGEWNFRWTLEGGDDIRMLEMNAALGDSGASVSYAELSPISIKIVYDFPRQEESELVADEAGQTGICSLYAEPPAFSGVRMKDGTVYTRLANAGSEGYLDEDSNEYQRIAALNRTVDVNQIESLLFIKTYPEGENALTEENLYIVPVE